MRNAFFSELLELFKEDSKVVFLTGDLGFKAFDPMKEIDPQRVINFGIRETGMVGFAAGLAKSGMTPFVYSIVPFMTLRCIEHIKIDLCYNKARVVVVGVGGGFSYGPNGPTHHGVEDICLISSLPEMTVWTPADPIEVRACVRASRTLGGPAYLRLGRNGEPNIHDPEKDYPEIDKPIVIEKNEDGVIVTCGFILDEVLKAARILGKKAIYPSIVQLPTIHPFPADFFRELLTEGKPVMTVEEHVSTGGLGQKTAKVLAELGLGNPFEMLSIPQKFCDRCLDRQAALIWAGLDAKTIAEKYQNLCSKKSPRNKAGSSIIENVI